MSLFWWKHALRGYLTLPDKLVEFIAAHFIFILNITHTNFLDDNSRGVGIVEMPHHQ